MKKMLIAVASVITFALTSQTVLAHKSKLCQLKTAEFTAANTDTSDDLTLAELSAYIASKTTGKFTALDINEDNLIDVDEFTANTPTKAVDFTTELFSLADADEDGNLDEDEFATTQSGTGPGEIIRYFISLDKNLDMLVSLEEYLKPYGHKKSGHY